MPTEPLSSPATVPKWKRTRFWIKTLGWIILVPLLLVVAWLVLVIVDEVRWSRHLKPVPPRPNVVATYDATTGARINDAFISGLTFPSSIAVSGDTLYVVQAAGNKLPPGRYDFGSVGKYDAKTGAAINPAFISSGLINPQGLVLSGTSLFINNDGISKVAAYRLDSGALINDAFIDNSFSAAGRQNANLKLAGIAASSDKLYVSDVWRGVVHKYYPNAGAEINHMEVCTGAVAEYDAATGAVIDHSLLGKLDCPGSLVYADDLLYVVTNDKGILGKYEATTGKPINASFIRGLHQVTCMAVGGGNIYMLNNEAGTVGKYNALTGAVISTPLIKGLVNPVGMAVSGNTIYLIAHADDAHPVQK